jgi:hypothetical protein
MNNFVLKCWQFYEIMLKMKKQSCCCNILFDWMLFLKSDNEWLETPIKWNTMDEN